jgi:predicted LPLAT superfamily acyltransferase
VNTLADRVSPSRPPPTAPASRPADAAPAPPSGTPAASGNWSVEPERSNLWMLRLMRWIAVAAGRPIARLVLHPITFYFLLAHAPARRASLQYLGRVLGRPARWSDTYRHIFRFASTVLDRVYFLQERVDQFEVASTNAEAIHVPLDAGEGVMLVGAHLGSFEALRASAQGRGARVAMLMYEDNARLINATLAAVAPKAQLHTIALGRAGAMLALRRWLDEGGIAGLLADRTLPAPASGGSERSRATRLAFLGAPARFSDGPFRLAAMLKRRVVFMAGLYHGGNRYELRFLELADFRPEAKVPAADVDQRVREALQRYVLLLEALCRESPYNWFNFFDFWADDGDVPKPPAR